MAKKHGRTLNDVLKALQKRRRRGILTSPFECPNCYKARLQIEGSPKPDELYWITFKCTSCGLWEGMWCYAKPIVQLIDIFNFWLDMRRGDSKMQKLCTLAVLVKKLKVEVW